MLSRKSSFITRKIQPRNVNIVKCNYYHHMVGYQLQQNFIRRFQAKPSIYSLSTLPTHLVVPMPALSPTMTSGSISKWNLKEGDKFDVGTVICEVETDKATVSYDATDSGYLAKILVEAGEIQVGDPIMITVEEQNEVAAFANYQGETVLRQIQEAVSVSKPSVSEIQEEKLSSNTTTTINNIYKSKSYSANDRIFVSPLARKLLKESGTSLHEVRELLAAASSNGMTGSGSSGRIVAADVVRAATLPRKATAASISQSTKTTETTSSFDHHVRASSSSNNIQGVYNDFQLSEQSIALAKRYTFAKQSVPHYYLSVELNLTKLLKLRSEINSQLAAGSSSGGKKDKGSSVTEISVLDFLIKASALAMKHVPDVNGSWMDTFVRRYEQVDINVVMGTSGTAPVIRDVISRGLSSISSEIDSFEQAIYSDGDDVKENFLANDSNSLGTFSIHNLGMFGIKSAAPIVLTPQACALALGTIVDTVIPAVVSDQNEWEVAPIMTATLSCDHRVVDGAVGAQWLSAFKSLVENPTSMLI